MAVFEWADVEAAFARLMYLPAATWPFELRRLAARDPQLAAELQSLLDQVAPADALLDHPAIEALGAVAAPDSLPPATDLAAGTRIGAWRIIDLIGRGGMGEVYRAERADGEFQQEAAIKRMRPDAAPMLARFQAERQILANLDHPGIARLLDGGLDSQGRPFMAMELVRGRHIHRWASQNAATLEQRLALFVQVCDAVAYAHRHLIVHRDIKPANVIVTDDGCPKLLDFGIARLLDGPVGNATRELMLTPGYAAPEQLSGDRVTTAADVYSLGLLLYELLVDAPAHAVQHLPMASAMQQVLTRPAPVPSRAAQQASKPAIPAHVIAGDLDAIVAKALRKEPEQRYASVDELRADIQRFLRHEVVLARRGGWSYVVGRTLRRHRTWTAAAAAAVIALMAGGATTAWQAHIARAQAERASAVSGFLVQVFEASDPRIAADKPRGQATARELLDAGASRIDPDFAAQPQVRVELLGLVAGIYQDLGETQRYQQVQARRQTLVRQSPGRYPEAEVEIELNQIQDALMARDVADTQRHLAAADDLIKRRGLDATAWRARWWIFVAQTAPRNELDKRLHATGEAIALLRAVAPRDCMQVDALYERGRGQWEAGSVADAAASLAAADRQYQSCDKKDDSMEASVLSALATTLEQSGHFDESMKTYERAEALALRTTGDHDASYWEPLANHAVKLHAVGDRVGAMQRFATLLALVPFPPTHVAGWEVYNFYARCLSAQGESDKALPIMRAIVDHYQQDPGAEYSLRASQQALGLALARLGRNDEARPVLRGAFDDYRLHEAADRWTRLLATEAWARFLVDTGEPAAARPLFEDVLLQDHGRNLPTAALAHAGIARVELAGGHATAALAQSAEATRLWASVQGTRNVRDGGYIERVHARCLLANGSLPEARALAQHALAQSAAHDVPQARSNAEARELIAAATAPGP